MKAAITAGSLARILSGTDPKRLVVVALVDPAGGQVWVPVRAVSATSFDAKRGKIGLGPLVKGKSALALLT